MKAVAVPVLSHRVISRSQNTLRVADSNEVIIRYVVDMIRLQFMDFPVFNVADCFICCGCIALIVHLLFFNKEFWKEEK